MNSRLKSSRTFEADYFQVEGLQSEDFDELQLNASVESVAFDSIVDVDSNRVLSVIHAF